MIRKIGWMLFIFLCCQVPMTAQEFVPTPVEKSTEKVRIQETLYYVHTVLKGQTLYSIGKAYGVDQQTLEKYNPTLKEGLKTGTLLYIPATSTEQVAEQTPQATAEQETDLTEKQMRRRFKKHTAKWYETLEDVAEKYEVPSEAIYELNKLETKELKRRQVLYIPDEAYLLEWQQRKNATAEDATGSLSENSFAPKIPVPDIGLYPNRPYTNLISLILPFQTAEQGNNVNQMDFYSGFLLGMKRMEDQPGMRQFRLNVVDLSQYLSPEEMIYSGVLEGSELIVGPVSAMDLNIVAAFAQLEMVPIVSPLDTKAEQLLENNPYLFQFPANAEELTEKLLERLTVADSARVTLVYERGTRYDKHVLNKFETLHRMNIPFDTLSYGILEGRGIDVMMAEKAHPTGLNQYVIASEREAFVSDVLRNLHLLRGTTGVPVRVFGEVRWKNYQTIEPKYYHDLNLQLPQLYYVNYQDGPTKAFVKEYNETFGTEPTPYAFQGYDIACYFTQMLSTYGWGFPVYAPETEAELIQSGVHFVPTATNSGFKNTKGRTISYQKNWEITY